MSNRTSDRNKATAPRGTGGAGHEAARSNPGTRADDSTVANRARQEGMRRTGPRFEEEKRAAAGDDGPADDRTDA